jgi:hypothetical protein
MNAPNNNASFLGAHEIAIDRNGSSVRFIVKCKSDNEAALLLHHLTESMRGGRVSFEIMTKPKVAQLTAADILSP